MITGIIIPAYMKSKRFRGKPLVDIGGKPLLSYAVEAAKESGLPWYVATHDREILQWSKENDVLCIDTTKMGLRPRNGTERAALVNREKKWDRVIVLQCDEPDITAEDTKTLSELESPATLVSNPIQDDWGNVNTVFAAVQWDTIRHFERGNDSGLAHMYRHVGAYLYESSMLHEYLHHPPTKVEERDSLEQIRTMALGYAWSCFELNRTLRSVNVPEDAKKFK